MYTHTRAHTQDAHGLPVHTHIHTHTHKHKHIHIHTYTHTHTLRTHAQITSAAAEAAMHEAIGLAHRLTDVALGLHAIE